MKKITKREQAELNKERIRQEKIEAHQRRLAYLRTFGHTDEVFISRATLKDIFTDKVIASHFPKPFATKINPNLSKSYQKDNPEARMKLYRLADVIEKIKAGVKSRLKSSLKDEYRALLQRVIVEQAVATLEAELPRNIKQIKTTNKI